MKLWVDAHLSPAVARWITSEFAIEAVAVRDLGMRSTKDHAIFMAARSAGVMIITKDSDFLDLVALHGPPPQIIWLTCGNTSNARLQLILKTTLRAAIEKLRAGENMVEIADASG
jgi:predicted nuclease of predicted toxin-antitoxin system